ncbi:PREDICTED: cysteine-rich repeat secretory protein 2 isoform X2 [Camelina sativa]|uniref:Cysteine-rich repeat secretory protein 2 isoform X2 n=1 Tax=Camelina sativa TaxID=90675 RepID=A0ABM0ST53_CAMSA|nr:PREDICTED: cysteine-rich repeat secretory protein 2 isoform X2 [Camelina sativa]
MEPHIRAPFFTLILFKASLLSTTSILPNHLTFSISQKEEGKQLNMSKTKTTLLCFLLTAIILMNPSSSAPTDNYIYAVCSPAKFSPGSGYETNLNSLLSSFVSSTVQIPYANFTVPNKKPEPGVTVYGVFQCRGDLDPSACSTCVSRANAQVGTLCSNSYSGFLMMDSCLVRYDNSSFFGMQDKTLRLNKCGQAMEFNDQDGLTRISDVIGSLGSGSEPYRTSGNGNVQGVAQCMGDLSTAQCQDCLSDAIGRLKSDCGMAQGGYVYLSKCYARFSVAGSHARQTPNYGEKKDSKDDNGVGKTLAIIIGIVTLIILLVVFLAFLGKQCRKLQDEKWCK